jgi:hypothetical protein
MRAGDDGYLQMGIAWPDPRFTDNGDNTVSDNLTGLIWLKYANCPGYSEAYWIDALSEVSGLAHGTCGLTDGSSAGDWRLPNMRELQSLLDYGEYNPALPSGHPFSVVPLCSVYWSSTTAANQKTTAWVYFLSDGGEGYSTKSTQTWCFRAVRGGQ